VAVPDSDSVEVADWLVSLARWLRPRLLPSILIAAGIGVGAFIAYRSRQHFPPTAPEDSFLVFTSSALNVGGAYLFSRVGRADPRHARSAVRRLLTIGRTVGIAADRLAQGMPSGRPNAVRDAAIEAHAYLVAAQEALGDSLQDWNDVHKEALREVLEAEKQDEGETVR